jgi:hypothetical protein
VSIPQNTAHNPQSKFDLQAARAAMETIRVLDLNAITIDKIKELLNPIFCGYAVTAPQFNPGLPLYSGLAGKPMNIVDISYPSAHLAPLGLANRQGEPILYCCTTREAALFELRPRAGDTVTLVHWVTSAPALLNHIGYTRRVFDLLGSDRDVPSWRNNTATIAEAELEEVIEFLADIFTRTVPPAEEQLYKKLTTAVAEMLFAADPFDGLLYPTLAMRANADNVALKPRFVDNHLRFLKAEFIQIAAIRDFAFDISALDTAREIGPKGTIEWYITSMDGNTALSKRYGTVGWQEFLRQKKDILNDYDSAKESNAHRAVQTEHGNVGEASFRKWLSEYLPKKYSVTPGFIIPDERSMNYVIRHYDVIVYDVLNSPVLWGSNNLDRSEQGRERAIPAKYVHAVFEVKATLTKKSIKDAVEKLQELNNYGAHLPAHFVSGAVFFEVRGEVQGSCELAEGLFKENVPGYFGGLILRAEGFDPNLTGYYHFIDSSIETVNTMPLIRDIGALKRDDRGNPQITEQGDVVAAYAIDDVWNFDKGYTPIVKDVHLFWSYNSFPQFFIDLLERLQGTYDPTKAPQQGEQGAYGLSFTT